MQIKAESLARFSSVMAAVFFLGLFSRCAAIEASAPGSRCDNVENGYRLSSDSFQADVSYAGATIGLSPRDPKQLYAVRWIYKGGRVKDLPTQIVRVDALLPVRLASFEVCMADVSPAAVDVTETPVDVAA